MLVARPTCTIQQPFFRLRESMKTDEELFADAHIRGHRLNYSPYYTKKVDYTKAQSRPGLSGRELASLPYQC